MQPGRQVGHSSLRRDHAQPDQQYDKTKHQHQQGENAQRHNKGPLDRIGSLHTTPPSLVSDEDNGNEDERPEHDQELGQASAIKQIGQDTASLGLETEPEREVEKDAGHEEGDEEEREA